MHGKYVALLLPPALLRVGEEERSTNTRWAGLRQSERSLFIGQQYAARSERGIKNSVYQQRRTLADMGNSLTSSSFHSSGCSHNGALLEVSSSIMPRQQYAPDICLRGTGLLISNPQALIANNLQEVYFNRQGQDVLN